ncbi:MAG: 50S ribosomal protein L29 [Clostridia bacterium]|nr:50S ribosomal protein L29 [Clostridia bacterium]MBQ9879926.1 50S ribosomal protein L29 [Clostridia bacterium]
MAQKLSDRRAQISAMSDADLDKELAALKNELFKLRFQQRVNQLDNPMRIKAVKKDIARILTVKTDRELHGSDA